MLPPPQPMPRAPCLRASLSSTRPLTPLRSAAGRQGSETLLTCSPTRRRWPLCPARRLNQPFRRRRIRSAGRRRQQAVFPARRMEQRLLRTDMRRPTLRRRRAAAATTRGAKWPLKTPASTAPNQHGPCKWPRREHRWDRSERIGHPLSGRGLKQAASRILRRAAAIATATGQPQRLPPKFEPSGPHPPRLSSLLPPATFRRVRRRLRLRSRHPARRSSAGHSLSLPYDDRDAGSPQGSGRRSPA